MLKREEEETADDAVSADVSLMPLSTSAKSSRAPSPPLPPPAIISSRSESATSSVISTPKPAPLNSPPAATAATEVISVPSVVVSSPEGTATEDSPSAETAENLHPSMDLGPPGESQPPTAPSSPVPDEMMTMTPGGGCQSNTTFNSNPASSCIWSLPDGREKASCCARGLKEDQVDCSTLNQASNRL